MSARKMSREEWLLSEIRAQRTWVDEHGRDEIGYVERYGSKDDPDHYGDGGEAIYRADQGTLDNLIAEYRRLTGRNPN